MDSPIPFESPREISLDRGQHSVLSLLQHYALSFSSADNRLRVGNHPFVLELESPVDVEALRTCIQSLIDRHSLLRTSFIPSPIDINREGPLEQLFSDYLQTVFEAHSVLADFAVIDCHDDEQRKFHVYRSCHEPFRFDQQSLFRVRLISGSRSILVISVCSLVADVWSLALMFDELRLLYQATANSTEPVAHELLLPQLSVDFAIHSQWIMHRFANPEGHELPELLSFWLDHLSAPLPSLTLPQLVERPRVSTSLTATYESIPFSLPSDLTMQLKLLAQDQV